MGALRTTSVTADGQTATFSDFRPETHREVWRPYPPAAAGFFNIGVFHTNLAGISEHANYAPCSLETLKNKGYQYWALGHVHNRQVLAAIRTLFTQEIFRDAMEKNWARRVVNS